MRAWSKRFRTLKELGITVVELMPVFQRDPQENDLLGLHALELLRASRAIRQQLATTMNSIWNSEIW
jgi:pullulanase/glycogen debranching enzyme